MTSLGAMLAPSTRLAHRLVQASAADREPIFLSCGSPRSELGRRCSEFDGVRTARVTARPTTAPSPLTGEPILDAPSPGEQRDLLQRSRVLLESRGVVAAFVAIDADPADALISVARSEHAALIVVGQTGSGHVTRALLGSTAENAFRHAPCDVLVVV
jgi:nucleotide-binding universal stress UspA family protein